MPLGLYISIPFCRTKCTYCNFASDVFSKAVFERYVDRLCSDLLNAAAIADQMGGQFERAVDSIYFGGGTPTILDIAQLHGLFVTISQNFQVAQGAEITVECAPGTLTPGALDLFHALGVNRVSLGVQSFVDMESASVARLHKRETVLKDIERLRGTGIEDINIDLIAGLPHQTPESWMFSLDETIGSGAPHVSVYMLEVDEDSRLGRELIAGGTKYHAHHVPDEDLTADLYLMACDRLEQVGIRQYEISNFARPGHESLHNLKYWRRRPYFGFGVDAHSMLSLGADGSQAVRFSTPDSLDEYLGGAALKRTSVDAQAALEEHFFLGLRLNEGVDLTQARVEFGDSIASFEHTFRELTEAQLLERRGEILRLTRRGLMLSNEVFERFIAISVAGKG